MAAGQIIILSIIYISLIRNTLCVCLCVCVVVVAADRKRRTEDEGGAEWQIEVQHSVREERPGQASVTLTFCSRKYGMYALFIKVMLLLIDNKMNNIVSAVTNYIVAPTPIFLMLRSTQSHNQGSYLLCFLFCFVF